MGRGAPRILEDFIWPSLNSDRFGFKLRWVDKHLLIFEVLWHHKSGPQWNEDCSEVFRAWDIMKQRPVSGEKYDMLAKGRFRAALHKIGTVEDWPCTDRRYKRYRIVSEAKKKKKSRVYDQEVDESPSSPDIGSFYGSYTDSPCQSPKILAVDILMGKNPADLSDIRIEPYMETSDNEISLSIRPAPQGYDIPLSALCVMNNHDALNYPNATQAAEQQVVNDMDTFWDESSEESFIFINEFLKVDERISDNTLL